MAAGKKSFICYIDWGSTFDELSDVEAGKLIKHLFNYVRDKNPELPNKLLRIAFEPIKQDLKRDLKKWDNYIEKQRHNGQLGGRPEKPKETQKTQAFFEKPKKADNVNVNVNVNDNVSIEKEKIYRIEECATIALADERWTRANKTNHDELVNFNGYLEKIGKYETNPLDYKKYFSVVKDKYPHLLKKEYTVEELKEIALKMDQEQLKLKAI